MRRGFTLLEVVIAILIFSVFTAMAMQVMLNGRNLIASTEDNDILHEGQQNVTRAAMADLVNCGWFYYDLITMGSQSVALYPQVHITRTAPVYNALGAAVTVMPDGSYFLPGVPTIPSPNRDAMVRTPKPTDIGRLTAEVLYFIKLRSERDIQTDPTRNRIDHLSFTSATSAWSPVRMDQSANAPQINSLIFNAKKYTESNDNRVKQALVSTVWESDEPDLDWEQNNSPSHLRIYRYCVLPDPESRQKDGTFATGILVRQYLNSMKGSLPPDNNTWKWLPVNGMEICRDVESVTFDTSYTDPILMGSQVRIRIGLLRQHANGAVTRKSYENVFAMRSLSNPND